MLFEEGYSIFDHLNTSYVSVKQYQTVTALRDVSRKISIHHMYRLNIEFLITLIVIIDLNTSYVSVKQKILQKHFYKKFSFNTSYVSVKHFTM